MFKSLYRNKILRLLSAAKVKVIRKRSYLAAIYLQFNPVNIYD